MSLTEIKQGIISNIGRVEELDLKKLYPNNLNAIPWQSMDRNDIEKFVKDTIETLKELKQKINLLDSAGTSYALNIESHLEGFINQFHNIRSLNEEQIISQHHSSLNQLSNVNTALRSSGIYTEIKFDPNLKTRFEELTKAEPLLKRILQNEEEFNRAIDSASEWLTSRDEINKKIFEEHAQAYLVRAKEHKIHRKEIFLSWKFSGNWWWLFGAFIFSMFIAYITYSFIQLSGPGKESISAGQTILRISSLLVPAYLTIFSSNQFLYHKKMYETYMFKFASLNTMNNLISTHGGKISTQEKILEKGLNVLFSEPTIKDDGRKYDKQLIGELLDMLKSQISKH